MIKRISIKVYGRVQGVFFRHTARIRATELSLTGWVANGQDGSVSVVAEGEPGALEHLLAWCRSGPPLARVERVETEWQEATGEFTGFKIA